MRPPPSNRVIVFSIVGTIACLLIVYFAVRAGEQSHAQQQQRAQPGAIDAAPAH